MGKPNPGDAARSNRIIGVVLTVMLAVSMIPVAGIQSAFADEVAERPSTTTGDAALEGYAAEATPVAQTREDGMLVADGLVYTIADGGLSLVGFDGLPEGGDAPKEIVVPEAVSVDGEDTPVVAVDIASGQVAGEAVVLRLPRSIESINTASLAPAFPNLLSVEVDPGTASAAPAAAGAAAMRAAYSSFGGSLLGQATVDAAKDDGSVESVRCRELVWAPPAMVVARVPVDCLSIASGAFVGATSLKTVVCFGDVERIAQAEGDRPGAFADAQRETVMVVTPEATPAVASGGDEYVSADMALNDARMQTDKRRAWAEAGWPFERIVMGKPAGALTETVAVGDDGKVAETGLRLVSYPGMRQNATDVKHPGEDGRIDMADAGLAFTVRSDLTLSVHWEGDPTATPSRVEIPAYITIDGVTYPVTEIAANAFEGSVFLESIAIPENVKAVGRTSVADRTKLERIGLSLSSNPASFTTPNETAVFPTTYQKTAVGNNAVGANEESANHLPPTQAESQLGDGQITPFSSHSSEFYITVVPDTGVTMKVKTAMNLTATSVTSTQITLTRTLSSDAIWGAFLTDTKEVQFQVWNTDGSPHAAITLEPPAGWKIASVGTNNRSTNPTGTNYADDGYVSLVRDEAVGGDELLTEKNASSLYAEKNHDHDSAYAKKTDLDNYYTKTQADGRYALASGNATQSWVNENFLTKAATDLDNFYDKADFNTISYQGLEDASWTGALPTFYVDDAAKRPTVPEPRREGHEFQGWTWGGQVSPTKDPSAAFSGGGAVTLTAVWEETEPETPEATHFFTGERPLRFDDASERQTHVIKVRLSNVPRTLASVSFEGDDRTHLLKETSGVELYVGSSEDALSSGTRLPWGGSTGSGWTCELAELAEGSYGVYVGISVPTSAIDEASVPVSYTDGSYVASLVKMNYVFA